MWTSLSIRGIALAAAIVASTASGATYADEISATRRVSTQGLDLASPDDQAKLRHSIIKAAKSVCAEVTDGLNAGDPDFRDCVREAFANGWGQAATRIAAAKARSLLASAATK
jgi:UrcA family protein